MVFLAMRGDGASHEFVLTCVVLQLPAIYLPFLVVFLPRADQPGTAWLFQQAPRLPLALVQDATWRALVTHVVLPVFVTAAVLAAVAGATGWQALPAVVFAAGLAILAARAAAARLDTMPFTAAKEAGSGPEMGSLFATAIVLGACGVLFGMWLAPEWRWPLALAALGGGVLALRSGRTVAGGDHVLDVAGEAAAAAAEPGETGAVVRGAPSTQAGASARDRAAAMPATGLGRELRAIAVLYVFACVLPILVGTLFAA
jgi:hypothetical protein